MPSGLCRARERDHTHPRIGKDGRADFSGRPGDHAEQTFGQPCRFEDLGDFQAGYRSKLGGLEHEAVAGGESITTFFIASRNGALKGAMPAITPSGWRMVKPN